MMKLFRLNGKTESLSFEYEEMELKDGADIPTPTGKMITETNTRIELELIPETVDYLLNKSGGATLSRIRQLIVNLFNCNYYDAPDLFALMRNADDEHAELTVNIIDSCSLKYGDSCFLMIDKLAPQIIDRFYNNGEENDAT